MSSRLIELAKNLETVKYGNFILSSGTPSNWKFYAEVGFASEEFSQISGQLAAELFYSIEKLKGEKCSLASIDTGGTLFLQKCLPYLAERNYVSIAKDNHIRGNVEISSYVVIDDALTKGGSVKRADNVIKSYGGKSFACIILLDREEGGREFLENNGIKVYSVLKKSDVI